MITIRQKMSLDGPAGRSDVEASAEPAVKSPSSDGETAPMRAAARGDVAEVKRHLDECGRRDASGRTALMIAAQGGHKEVVEAFLEHEKGMRDNQNHSALLGSQEWAHRSRQDRHSPRGPDRRERGHCAHAGRRERRR
ncbi:Pre-mRNA splicing helicase BRR2 [Giardia duodenalis]|uniref:Pre-mRNA splicing helicase BRR2 n=1 Tax=Giardia intestinalis TaxID=5741 RepID=V6TNL1_GIAIN|nr:Pre-mRNA splicing helicase BRR2 [Giardia intestinalis]